MLTLIAWTVADVQVLDHPLAERIDLNKGSAQVTVPSNVSPGADYIIVCE